jgi:catechol 2,3-dioxygenase-like lactoylglutathione lyase family enzyme
MKRLHVHVGVADLDQSIGFYSTLFGTQPSVRKDDYAKWMLDDPRVNFAISVRGGQVGLDHLGVQAETADELDEIADRLKAADQSVFEQTNAACCYAKSDKAWAVDPTGLRWETFHTTGEITTYGEDGARKATQPSPAAGPTPASSCCGPKASAVAAPATAPTPAAKACCG